MNYEEFEGKIISQLVKDKKKVIDTIENNKKLIDSNLRSSTNIKRIRGFIEKLNYIIVEELKKYKLIEKVLRHELFIDVLNEFRESTILIKAIQKKKLETIKWLFSMNINIFVQDENGMTALHHAAECSLFDVVKELLNKNIDLIYINDKNDDTVLLYALSNEQIFNYIVDTGKVDIYHINKNNENLLTSSCKHKKFEYFKKVFENTKDLNLISYEGKTAAMYLIENGRHEELDKLLGKISNYDMSVKFNQVYVTILINQFKDIYINSKCKLIENYIKTMRVLNKYEYNFNVPIDEEGNTPFMFFMMIGDLCSCCFLLERFKRLDLSIKNKKGLSVSYLSLFIDSYENVFLKSLTEHPTFDYDYIDNNNNSLLMHYVVRNQYSDAEKAAIKSKRTLDHINNKNENILIIATKLGRLKEYFITPNNINHQDNLGNTPLAYALKLRDATFINLLMHNHADPYIMNYQGTSSIDLANEINESRILDILNKPLPPKEMEKKLQEDRKGFLFFDKKKSKEEKTDDYLKNYQINNYKEEYKDFLNSTTEWTYSNVIKDKPIESIIVGIYINLYMYSISAPKKLLMERDDRDFRRRMVYHGIAGGIDDMTIFGTKNRLR